MADTDSIAEDLNRQELARVTGASAVPTTTPVSPDQSAASLNSQELARITGAPPVPTPTAVPTPTQTPTAPVPAAVPVAPSTTIASAPEDEYSLDSFQKKNPTVPTQPATIAPIVTPPAAPTTPQPTAAPGMNELAQKELTLAQEHHDTRLRILADPQMLKNPIQMKTALELNDHDLNSQKAEIELQKSAAIQARSNVIGGYADQIHSGKFGMDDYEKVRTDTRLDPESKEKIFGILEAHGQNTVAGKTASYGPGYLDQRQLLFRPDADPNKIRDPSQVLALGQEGPNGEPAPLSPAGVVKMLGELREIQSSPYAANFGKKEVEFYKDMEQDIKKAAVVAGILDKKSNDNFYRFLQDFQTAKEQILAQGKNPFDLLNPHSPEYFGRPDVLMHYQRTMDQVMADAKADRFPPVSAENIALLKAHPDQRDVFDKVHGAGEADKILGAKPGWFSSTFHSVGDVLREGAGTTPAVPHGRSSPSPEASAAMKRALGFGGNAPTPRGQHTTPPPAPVAPAAPETTEQILREHGQQ